VFGQDKNEAAAPGVDLWAGRGFPSSKQRLLERAKHQEEKQGVRRMQDIMRALALLDRKRVR
jgi:hypothetical protein